MGAAANKNNFIPMNQMVRAAVSRGGSLLGLPQAQGKSLESQSLSLAPAPGSARQSTRLSGLVMHLDTGLWNVVLNKTHVAHHPAVTEAQFSFLEKSGRVVDSFFSGLKKTSLRQMTF